MIEFTEKLRVMNETIVKAMAKSLNLEENCFLYQFGENPNVLSSFNFYPPCPWPDLYVAAKAHSDASATTCLLQDKEVEGLQVLKDDKWHRVPLTPDAILFNIGDQVQVTKFLFCYIFRYLSFIAYSDSSKSNSCFQIP